MKFKRRIASVIALGLIPCAVFSSCSLPTTAVEKLDNPKLAISEFIECLSEKRFDDYHQYLNNYASLGFEDYSSEAGEDAIKKYICDNIFDSYSVSFADNSFEPVSGNSSGIDYSISGQHAAVTFTLTAFDTDKLQRRVSALAEEIAAPAIKTGYVYDTDEKAMALINEAMTALGSDDPSEFYSDSIITADLEYSGGRWLINISDEFFAVLCGDAVGSPIADWLTAGVDLIDRDPTAVDVSQTDAASEESAQQEETNE